MKNSASTISRFARISIAALAVAGVVSPNAWAHEGHTAAPANAPAVNVGQLPRLVSTNAVGAQEVGTIGDADGSASVQVVLVPSQGRACLIATAQKVALPATLVHIHNAPAGTNGPVAIDFTSVVQQSPVAGVISGCVNSPKVAAVASNPSNYYVNIHTAEFPKGAVRGQLA